MNQQFQRIERLPPYVFNIIGELKQAARARGEDIIDFGMGNPDQPTPEHIVDKLKETVNRGDTHRYSQSKGIPRLRQAICNWYQSRYEVELDPDSEAIVTLGSKEGLAQPRTGNYRCWRCDSGAQPFVSNSSLRVRYFRCRSASCADDRRGRFFRGVG